MSATAIEPPRAPARHGLFPLTLAQAFCVHLTLSLLIFSTLVFAMLRWWFPGELFFLDGGWQGLKLVAMVDLVLGPALTLLLYRPGKPKLALDMSLIAAIQILALGYGFVTTHAQRTVAVVYADDAFNTVSAEALHEAEAELREREIEPPPFERIAAAGTGEAPLPMLMTPRPSGKAYGKYLADLLNGYPEPHERIDLYVAIGADDEALADRALTLEDLPDEAPRAAIETALADAGLTADEVELHRFRTRYASGTAIYDPRAVRIVDYVPSRRTDGSGGAEPPAAAATPMAPGDDGVAVPDEAPTDGDGVD